MAFAVLFARLLVDRAQLRLARRCIAVREGLLQFRRGVLVVVVVLTERVLVIDGDVVDHVTQRVLLDRANDLLLDYTRSPTGACLQQDRLVAPCRAIWPDPLLILLVKKFTDGVRHSLESLGDLLLSQALPSGREDAAAEDEEDVAAEADEHDDAVVDDEAEEEAEQQVAEDHAHAHRRVVREHEQVQAQEVRTHLIEQVLVVDDSRLPGPLADGDSEHGHRAKEEEPRPVSGVSESRTIERA